MRQDFCGVQLIDKKRANDLMLMLGLNDTIDQLAMACSLAWSYIEKRE